MLTGCLPREGNFTNQAQAHVLTENSEYLADPVGAGDCCDTADLVIGSHVLLSQSLLSCGQPLCPRNRRWKVDYFLYVTGGDRRHLFEASGDSLAFLLKNSADARFRDSVSLCQLIQTQATFAIS